MYEWNENPRANFKDLVFALSILGALILLGIGVASMLPWLWAWA